MSSPGYFYGDEQNPQMKMASALMGGDKPGPFGGIGTAIQMKALQNRMAQNAYEKAPAATMQGTIPAFGGLPAQKTTVTAPKMPYMGPQGLSGLFNLGGG